MLGVVNKRRADATAGIIEGEEAVERDARNERGKRKQATPDLLVDAKEFGRESDASSNIGESCMEHIAKMPVAVDIEEQGDAERDELVRGREGIEEPQPFEKIRGVIEEARARLEFVQHDRNGLRLSQVQEKDEVVRLIPVAIEVEAVERG